MPPRSVRDRIHRAVAVARAISRAVRLPVGRLVAILLGRNDRGDRAEHGGKSAERSSVATGAGGRRLQAEGGQCDRGRGGGRNRTAQDGTHVRPRLVVPLSGGSTFNLGEGRGA